MNSQTAQLIASVTPRPIQNCQGLDTRELVEKLLNRGYQRILLSGALIDQFSDGVILYVDNDVDFFFDCYLHLETLSLVNEPYNHFACLNDGVLNISAKSNTIITKIKFEYWPNLNAANLVTYIETVAANEYVWWWRSIANEILDLEFVN